MHYVLQILGGLLIALGVAALLFGIVLLVGWVGFKLMTPKQVEPEDDPWLGRL
jgi:hypothetical protein